MEALDQEMPLLIISVRTAQLDVGSQNLTA